MDSEAYIKCVEMQLGRTAVTMEDRFLEDLGAESVDMVHLAVLIEQQSGLFLPVETIPDVETVGDLYNYIQTLH